MDIDTQFLRIKEFLEEHSALYDRELLEYYPNNLPGLYSELSEEIISFTAQELIEIETNFIAPKGCPKLQLLLNQVKELSSLPQVTFPDIEFNQFIKRKMSLKKEHELINIVGISKNYNWKNVIDFGGGAGHSSMTLLQDNTKNALCLDMDEAIQKMGQEKINRYLPDLKDRLNFKNICIKNEDDLIPLITDDTLVLGLHACGNLSSYIVKSMQSNKASTLINFGCCYHKIEKDYNLSSVNNPLWFSDHSLSLAAHCYKKIDLKQIEQRKRVKSYRYALHFYLYDNFNLEFITIGNAHSSDYQGPFREYAQKYMPKECKSSTGELEEFYNDSKTQKRLSSYINSESIRTHFGRLIELYIILDRAMYLKELGHDVNVTEVFDKSLSPRNIALTATKNTQSAH